MKPSVQPDLFPNPCPVKSVRDAVLCALAIDAEEDFNWVSPVYGTSHSVTNMNNINVLQDIVSAYGLVPTYLLTYPVLQNKSIVDVLSRLQNQNQCELGVQLHPWVTPPFDTDSDAQSVRMSFAGNLPPEMEEQKLIELCRQFFYCFGFSPIMYRAGRYGLGSRTPILLQQLGFRIDTSLAPRTNFAAEGGPDYTSFGYAPFLFGQPSSRVLEVPLCREIVGWTGSLAPTLYAATRLLLPTIVRAASVASWTRSAERITLSPEGNDAPAMKRLLKTLHKQRCNVFVLSFHSSSLQVGRNPYVQTRADLHSFYDRLSETLSYICDDMKGEFVKLSDLLDLLIIEE